MTPWQSGDIQANGLRLHYTRAGQGGPPLLLAHGFSDDGRCWTSTAQALEGDYDIIMLDARGHGRSQAPEHGYGPADHAADLAGVISALGLHRPVVFGHSMGAASALALAGLYPALPRAIVLEDPPPGWLGPREDGEAGRARTRAWLEALKAQPREAIIAEQRAAAPNWPPADLGPWADAKLAVSFNTLEPAPETAEAVAARLQRITCPALLITADPALGAIVTPAAAARLQELVPQLRLAHVPGAGHSIRRDQPARYIQVVREFLAGL